MRSENDRPASSAGPARYTVDASVFVNAFSTDEPTHAVSLEALAAIHRRGDPLIVPALLLVEVAAAVARGTDDADGALQYAKAIAELPHITIVPLTATMAGLAAEVAAARRLRGADAVYAAVARRYGTSLVALDKEQRARAAAIVTCLAPADVIVMKPRRRRRRATAE